MPCCLFIVSEYVFSAICALTTGFSVGCSDSVSVIIAMGVLTGTFSVSSATSICFKKPGSTASTSIVALSVSISAIASPGSK